MISQELWNQLKIKIEKHISNDPMISDVMINLQVKVLKANQKNILKINAKTE